MAGEDEFNPQVLMTPEVQAEMDKAIAGDPELGKAITAFKEAAMNAMQGMKDGRYASFEDAMEAITGERPKVVEPPNPPKHGYFSGIGRDPAGDGYLCIITDGNPKDSSHDPITVMDVGRFRTEAEAEVWAKETVSDLPWRLEEEVDAP